MRALITGGGGQLASDLSVLLGEDARSLTREELDITDADAVRRIFAELQPEVVFNCAAFHNVDLCERERERAWMVNVDAVRTLAQLSPMLVYISTNYVFDGYRADPYGEADLPSPRSVYALTKLAGEHVALAYAPRALVVRTAGLYGLHGSASKGGNFVHRMIARARERGSLQMVDDQCLQPTFTADLAEAIIDAVQRRADGIVHITSSGACSWYDFTRAIMARAGIDVPIDPINTTIAPGSVDRPLNGVLARPRSAQLGLPVLRSWKDALTDYMTRARLAAAASMT